MQKIMGKFSKEIRDAVAAEKLVRIKGFPVKDCCFVTPEMERLYKERTGAEMPGICVLCLQYPAIMTCDGPGLKGITEGIEVYQLWAEAHPQ
jgi:hypothetical protein